MSDLWVALGLVLVIEGFIYSVFPARMMRMMSKLSEMPVPSLRASGILSVMLGWLVVWFVRG